MNSTRIAACAAILSSATIAQTPCIRQSENSLVVIEVESVMPTGDWKVETDQPGFTGTSYYRWEGPDYFNSPGYGILTYDFEVHEAGDYELRIRNRHEHPDSTSENDCWVRIDDGPWIKLYSNGAGTVAEWNWLSRFEIGAVHMNAGFDLTLGRHVLEISGRSHGFAIDRLNIYKGTPLGYGTTYWPESSCGLGGSYCLTGNNSSGGAAEISAHGSVSLANNAFELRAEPVPADVFGLFYFGSGTVSTPFGNGWRCVGGSTFRLPMTTALGNTLTLPVDFSQDAATTIQAGSQWHFQAWFRDLAGGGAGFDLSDGLHVNFLP